MRYWSVTWAGLPANAMALFPFMLFKDAGMKDDPIIIRHEKIHFYQQLELLILPFYILYLLHYLIGFIKFRNHQQAYFNLCFEREAYANDKNSNYLKNRRPYAWLKHF